MKNLEKQLDMLNSIRYWTKYKSKSLTVILDSHAILLSFGYYECYRVKSSELNNVCEISCYKVIFSLKYRKTCLKGPLKNRQNKGLKDKW